MTRAQPETAAADNAEHFDQIFADHLVGTDHVREFVHRKGLTGNRSKIITSPMVRVFELFIGDGVRRNWI